MVADLGKSALMHTARLMNSLAKRSKKDGDKSVVAFLKKHERYDRTVRPVVYDSSNTRQLGCVFQDTEPPESLPILRKRAATQRNANIQENKGLSLGKIQFKVPH